MFQQRSAWACGGMVDTLVLGTSAKAWEFESLHAQISKKEVLMYLFFGFYCPFCSEVFSVIARAKARCILMSGLVGSIFAVILRTKSEESPFIATLRYAQSDEISWKFAILNWTKTDFYWTLFCFKD